jgi:integrase
MGIYTRPDSPFWWMLLEEGGQRLSTGIPRHGGSPEQDRELKRQAKEIYVAKQAFQAKQAAGLITVKPSITFGAYVQWYEKHVVSHRRGATRDQSILRNLVRDLGRQTPLDQIDAHRVREWMTARKAAGLSASTVNRELDVLKALLTSAVPKYLDRPPLSEIRRFRIAEREPRILTPEEETRLLAVADDEGRALLMVAIDTLMRLSNVVHLQWAQVKQSAIVPLNAKVSHDKVPITIRMRSALDRLPKDGPYVFASLHRKGSGKTSAKNRAIRLFDALCAQALVPHGHFVNGVTFHCLRHTGATRALQAGASVRTVMKLGGWKDLRSVLRYTHATDLDVQMAAESIGNHVSLE